MYPYRVFVSYSHEDKRLAEKLVAHLKRIGMHPVWDRDIRPGQPFSKVIKNGIAHAHVFLPILTRKAVKRPWVHQETGYAMGLAVPVMPIGVGRLPAQMLQDLHAMDVRRDFKDLAGEALGEAIKELMDQDYEESEATFRCAGLPELRAELQSRYTREAMSHKAFGPLRQAGALTSFNLPREPVADSIWVERDGNFSRGELLRRFYREERLALEGYVREHGCDLIIDPSIRLEQYGPKARKIRLSTLLAFLEDTSIPNVRVAVRKRGRPRNLTIVGDWFSAESIAVRPGKGYLQTVFTWHAPTVLEKIRKFDRDFAQLLPKAGLDGESSRQAAVEAVEREIDAIKE